jgi:hypothetical protein
MVWIPLPDPSDPDYFDKLHDVIPEARPALPEDYFIIDLTDESYGPLGRRLADAEEMDIPRLQLPLIDYGQLPPLQVPILEHPSAQADDVGFLYPFEYEPHEIMDWTDDTNTTLDEPEAIITDEELRQTLNSPDLPINLPNKPDYPRPRRRPVDLSFEITDAWIDTKTQDDPTLAFIKLHELRCLRDLEREEGKVRESIERMYQITGVLRKYEAAKSEYPKKDKMPRWFGERTKEVIERRPDYLRFLALL